jgi:hypothetical protein
MTEEDMDEVLEKFEETQQVSQEYSKYQSEIKNAKQELAQKVAELEKEEKISTTKAEEISRQIQNANYGKARQLMKEALEKQGLDFDAEEKNLFAQKFTDSYNQLQEDTERIRNSLLDLKQGADRDDLITYLYGKHSQFTKSDLRSVFDALDKIEKNKFGLKDQARVLAAFDHDLTITTTTEILREIKNEAENQ